MFEQLPPEQIVRLKNLGGIGDVTNQGAAMLRFRQAADGRDIVSRRAQHGCANPDGVGGIRLSGRQQREGQFFVAQLRFRDIWGRRRGRIAIMPAAASHPEVFQQSW